MAPYTDTTWIGGLELAGPPQELSVPDTVPEPLPDASPGPTDDFVRAYANEQANSRVNCPLPEGRWEIAWRAKLPVSTASSRIFRHGDKILLEGTSQWYLFQQDGNFLATGALDEGGVTIDAERRVFYSMTLSGYLAARHLADGSPAFYIEIDFGNFFIHPFLAPRKARLLASGIERQPVPDATSPLASSLQLMDIGRPPEVDKDRILTSFKTIKTLMRRSENIHVAMNEDTVVIAAEDLIYIADPEFSIKRVLAGYFSPISMSLDELSNIYLLARSPAPISSPILLGTTPGGNLFCTRQLTGRVYKGTSSPVIGFDHTIYLLLHDRIQAFTMRGESLWEGHASGAIAGAVVTQNGKLVVGGGKVVSAFDAEGHMTILQAFDGEAVCSQPLPSLDGSLYVATEDHFYRLISRKK